MASLKLFGRTFSFRDSISNPTKWLISAFGGGTDVAAGMRINEVVAMRNRTVWSCVRIISSVVAQFPLPVYRKDIEGQKERLDQHPLYRILNRRPNERMTAFHFRQTLMSHLLTWGNAYAFIDRDNAGRVKALWPLLPDRTRPQLNEQGKIIYLTRIKNDPNGISSSDNQQLALDAEDVLHIPGLSFDGLKGYSVIQQMREDIGLGLALTEYAARFFGNGAVPGFVLQHDSQLSPEQKTILKTTWEEGHQGLINSNRIAILERGLKVEKISIPPEDAQFLESRQFSKEEIAEIFGVPVHLLSAMDKTTGAWSGLEQLSLQFLQYTINPILENWMQSIDVRLFTEEEQADNFEVEFITADLLRSDIASRGTYYKNAAGLWMTANDIRRLENLAPWDDDEGEVKYLPPGAVPLSIALNPPTPTVPGSSEPDAAAAAGAQSPRSDSGGAFDVRRPVERLLTDVLERTVKRERVDMVKKKKYDGSDVSAFLESNLKPIVEAFDLGDAFAQSVVSKHVGESVRLLGDGGEIGIEAAFGTSVNRVARETASALASITTAPASTAGVVMDGMLRTLTELATRKTEPSIVNNNITMPAITPTFTMPEQPITIQPAEVRVDVQPASAPVVEVKPVINVAAAEAVATEVVYHTKGALKGAVKGQRPVKELKD